MVKYYLQNRISHFKRKERNDSRKAAQSDDANIYTILTQVPSGLRADSAYFAFEIESGGHKKNPRQLGAAGFSVHNR